MSALAFTLVALLLVGPVPALLARATWPMRAPRAAIVLWQSIALAAVLSAFSAGIAIASRLFVPGPDGRPTATITSEIEVLGWPLWIAYVAGLRAHPADRCPAGGRRACRWRSPRGAGGPTTAWWSTCVGNRRSATREPAACASSTSRNRWPTACPACAVASCVSEGTLTTLADNEIAAILRHERAHLRARHDLVLEMFTAVHAAFPRFVRSASALDAVRLLIELLADDAAVRAAGPTPLARALVACAAGRAPVGRAGRGRPDHRAAGAPARRSRQQPRRWRRRRTWPPRRCSSCPPSRWRCRG